MAERICKHCLIWDNMPEEMEHYLETYIAGIPEDDRAEDEVMEKRQLVCKDCNMFQEGLCRACGCYVALRTAVRKQKCPYKKWD